MTKYEMVVPPVKEWPKRFAKNYGDLYRPTVGRLSKEINSLRRDIPMERSR